MAAGFILYNMTGQIPFVGETIRRLLLHPCRDFFVLPYLYHVVLLPAFFLLLLNNVHSWKPESESITKSLLLIVPIALFMPIPVDINPSLAVNHVKGPWFFWGIQEMLRYLPAALAGIVLPVMFMVVFCVLPWLPDKLEKPARALIYAGVLVYGCLCVAFWFTW